MIGLMKKSKGDRSMKVWMSGLVAAAAIVLAACGQSSDQSSAGNTQTADAEPMTCEALAGLVLPETMISSAVVVPAGPLEVPGARPGAPGASPPPPPEVPSFCRVSGVIAPDNHFEVWLPMKDAWNGRFEMVGGGGLAGVISYGAMIPNINAGYVTASTDTGHVASDYTWLRDPAKVVDYGYRSVHETTVKAKALLAAFYAKPADYNYFNGCSTGGRQGLMEAQRYPDDYDGIVSGAPVNWFVNTHVAQLWMERAAQSSPAARLTPENLATITKAVMAQCDMLDGVKDNLLTDPRSCKFDPGTLLCKKGQKDGCLTAEQIDTVKKIYEGPVNPTTGEHLWVGMEPGGESPMDFIHGWTFQVSGDGPADIPKHYFGDMVFQDDNWDWKTFDFDKDVKTVDERTGQILNAIDPNLDAFSSHGGKLIIYHGWSDPLIFPKGTVRYYEEVVDHEKAKGADDPIAATRANTRLFMVPGMGHCRGGPEATDQFDMQSAVEAWVEKGQAPEKIIAAHKYSGGQPDRTRPLCPYPEVAKYDGQGDTEKAESFSCGQ
jgi:Tannase and feruloyl esterase